MAARMTPVIALASVVAVGTAVYGSKYITPALDAVSPMKKDNQDRFNTPVFNYAKHVSNGSGSHVYPQRAFMSEAAEEKLASGDAAIAKAMAIRKAKAEAMAKQGKESIVEH